MNALRDQFRGRARIWVAAFLVSSVLSIMVYLLGSPWYVMFTPMETVRNFALFWLILFFLFGLTKKGKGHLLLLVVGTSLLGWGLLTFGRRSLTERLIAIGSKLCEDEVKVPKFEVGLDLSQKAEAQFRSNKKPIFVSASFYAFIPSGSPTLPPRRVQLATEDEIARVDVATFHRAEISLKELQQLADTNYYVSLQASSARTFLNRNDLYCTSPTYRINELKGSHARIRCSLIDEPQVKLEQSKEPPLPEVVADMNDSNDWHETQRAIHDKVRELENLKCDQDTWRLDAPITVGQSLGGRIARIRVLHYLSRMKRIPLSTEPRLSDVREEMHKVWTGKFDGSACNIMWAEMTSWDLQAILEFDDGRTAMLVTDGWHVAMQNRDGNVRFFRLLHDAP